MLRWTSHYSIREAPLVLLILGLIIGFHRSVVTGGQILGRHQQSASHAAPSEVDVLEVDWEVDVLEADWYVDVLEVDWEVDGPFQPLHEKAWQAYHHHQ